MTNTTISNYEELITEHFNLGRNIEKAIERALKNAQRPLTVPELYNVNGICRFMTIQCLSSLLTHMAYGDRILGTRVNGTTYYETLERA